MAVSIWEGNKAQALIDAILSTEKLNTQQGAGQAGRVLAIGSDGRVVPAYVVLPDNVKNALMDCFTHVMWKDSDGEKYGTALRAAMYSETLDERIAYGIPANSDMSKYIISDTNAPVRDSNKNEDFTILIKGTWENIENQASFLVNGQGIYNGTSIIGLRIQTDYNTTNGTISFRATYKSSGGNSQSYSGDSTHDVVFIIRSFSGHLIIKIYVDGVLDYSFDDYVVNKVTSMNGNYQIGTNNSGERKPWTGSIDVFNIYNVALSNLEIKDLVGIEIPV